ncbi:hypothetical protein GCM10017776_25170 [Streptomyces griseoluteus]|nr:hypothetical protein GCM10017776_25170 [Streptomyces griseoluteus]
MRCGTVKEVDRYNLTSGRAQTCGSRKRHPRPPQGDPTTYGGTHQRIARLMGKASAGPCWICGSTAAEWAYSNADPGQRYENGMAYTPDICHYLRMCRPCHRRFDRAARLNAPGRTTSLPHTALWLRFFESSDETNS